MGDPYWGMLTVWKRHSPGCKKQLLEKGVKAANLRLHHHCTCACWITGKHPLTGEYIKKSLDTTSWEAAGKLRIKIESSDKSIAQTLEAPLTVEGAIDLWIADRRRIGTSESTIACAYRALRLAVLAYTHDRGIRLLAHLTDQEVFRMVTGWASRWKPSTCNRQISNLRTFFKFCIIRHWIPTNPALGIEPPREGETQVAPYTPAEEGQIERALATWTGDIHAPRNPWCLRPDTLRCFKRVLDETGLRVSDALRVRPEIIERLPSGDGQCTLVEVKGNGNWRRKIHRVTVYLSRETLCQIASVPRISPRYPFMEDPGPLDQDERSTRFKQHVERARRFVYYAFRRLGKTAGIQGSCRPHRFRHTFAVKKLKGGKSLENVSRLLGHSKVAVTDKYYASWTEERQEVLRNDAVKEFARARKVTEIARPRKKEIA